MQFKLTSTQSQLIEQINKEGKVWVTGGAIRDTCLGIKPKDLDFITNVNQWIIEDIIRSLGLTTVPDQMALRHGITRVVDKDTGEIIDIARLRRDCQTDGRHAIVEFTDSLEEDLARRDFTINAMAAQIDLEGKCSEIIDPYGGQRHIKERRINWVGEADTRIREDALRLVRLCRFGALWEDYLYEVAPYHIYKDLLNKISKERIRDEIIKAMGYPFPGNFFRSLRQCGLLCCIMPDLGHTVDCEQNYHHDETVFEHSVSALDVSVTLTDNPLLRLAILLHDIGKPDMKTVDADGNTHFFKHEVHGAILVRRWMYAMKFSNEEIEYVTKMVKHHMWRFTDETKRETVKRWLNIVGLDDWRDLITLRSADRRGNATKRFKPMVTSKMKDLIEMAEDIINTKEPLSRKDLAINGSHLRELNFKPGEIFAQILNDLVEIVLDDPTKNEKEWLVNYVKRTYG